MPEPRVQRVQVHPMPFVFINIWMQCGCTKDLKRIDLNHLTQTAVV